MEKITPIACRLRAAFLAALFIMPLCGSATGQPPTRQQPVLLPTVVVFQAQGGQPIVGDITDSFVIRLGIGDCGLKAIPFDANSPTVQRALREHEFLRASVGAIASPVVADIMGDAVGADLTLTARLDTQGGQAKLSARLAATRSRMSRNYDASAPVPQGWPDNLQPSDARALVESLTAPVAQEICKDAASLARQVPSDPAEHCRRGQELMSQGKAADASVEFNIAAGLEPGNADYHVAAGEADAALGDTQGAVIEYNRALQAAPNLAKARLKLALLYLDTGKAQEAIRLAEAVLDSDPANVDARLTLARAWRGLSEQAKALAQYERLLVDQPNNEEALRALAAAYDEKQAWDRAIPLYSRLVQVAPGDDQARERLIQLYVKVGNLAQAVAELRKAFELLGEPARYQLPQFVALVRMMDRECLAIMREAASEWDAYQEERKSLSQLKEAFEALHQRSDNLYHAAEKTAAPDLLAPAHRFRVLAYAVLNESDFEMVRFADSQEKWRAERARMLRDSAQSALTKAQSLEAQAGWPTITEAER